MDFTKIKPSDEWEGQDIKRQKDNKKKLELIIVFGLILLSAGAFFIVPMLNKGEEATQTTNSETEDVTTTTVAEETTTIENIISECQQLTDDVETANCIYLVAIDKKEIDLCNQVTIEDMRNKCKEIVK